MKSTTTTPKAGSLQDAPPTGPWAMGGARAWRLARLQQCRRRATELGRPVLVRFHLCPADVPALGHADPWHAWPGEAPHVLWHHGRAGDTLAAWGELARLPLAGARPERAAQAALARLLGEVVDLGWTPAVTPQGDMPLCHVAMAFDPARPTPQAPPDAGPPAGGELLLPARQVMRPGGRGAFATLAGWLGPGDDPQALMARLEGWLAGMAPGATARAATAPAPTMAAQEPAASWRERVRRAAGAVAGGALDKVVLARAAAFAAPVGHAFCPQETAEALRARQPQSITFLWRREGGAAFVGASPELLVAVAGRQVATHALAGTAPRGAAPEEDAAHRRRLLASAKDRREHALVVEMLRAALGPHCQTLEVAEAPEVLALSGLQHLQTPLSGHLRQAGGVLDLVGDLHPTPAVCGWPREAARDYLRAHEPLARSWYAGPIGWVTAGGDGAFAVALRSAWVEGARALAYAGAGVVAASDPAAEWAETELKLATIGAALRAVRQGADTSRVPAPTNVR